MVEVSVIGGSYLVSGPPCTSAAAVAAAGAALASLPVVLLFALLFEQPLNAMDKTSAAAITGNFLLLLVIS
ncbi:hypothetical protein D3C81_1604080 [compost metagenome]